MNTTTVVPPAPRRKRRRSGLGIYQDRTGRWHLDLIIAGLRRHRSYGHISFEEAKARAKVDGAAFRMERLTGVSATPAVVDITVAAALGRYAREAFTTLRPATQQLYHKLIKPLREHLGDCRLSALSAFDVERYKRLRTTPAPGRQGTGQVMCNRELTLLSAVIRACREWKLTTRTDNPVRAVKRFKESKGRDRVVTYEEETALLARLPEPHRTLTQLALETGLRLQSEGVPLTWADVDLDKARLHIKASDAKSGKERWLPLGDMVSRLRAMKATSTSPLIFAGPRGGPLTHFKTTYRRAVRAAGLAGTGLNVHCLRHTWASRLTESSGDLLLVQKLGGWSSLLLVQRYAHLRAGRDVAAIRAMLEARESHRQSHSATTVVPLKG